MKKEHVNEFVNSNGRVFTVRGLPPLSLPSLSATLVYPKKPTYEIVTASGDKEIHEHDEKSLTTDEDRQAWETYIAETRKTEEELSNRMLTCILIEGIDVADDIDLTRWSKKQKLMGMEVPDDIEERILMYKRSEVIRSPQDIQDLMRIVMQLTGVSQEVLELTKKSFPD